MRKSDGEDQKLITTAHHEAGHAVACVVLGIEIVDCWIDCDGGRVNHRYPVHIIVGGHDVTEDNYDANVENAYRQSIVIALAGEAAQLLYDPQSIGAYERGLAMDRAEIQRLLGCIKPPADRDAILAECKVRANNLVKAHWPQVVKLATVLIERRSISGQEIAVLLAS
jgi:hypothetical protein